MTCVILSEALFATYVPVDVRESAPRTTPPSYWHAMMVVCRGERGGRNSGQRPFGGAFERVAGEIARVAACTGLEWARTPVEISSIISGATPSAGDTPYDAMAREERAENARDGTHGSADQRV